MPSKPDPNPIKRQKTIEFQTTFQEFVTLGWGLEQTINQWEKNTVKTLLLKVADVARVVFVEIKLNESKEKLKT